MSDRSSVKQRSEVVIIKEYAKKFFKDTSILEHGQGAVASRSCNSSLLSSLHVTELGDRVLREDFALAVEQITTKPATETSTACD